MPTHLRKYFAILLIFFPLISFAKAPDHNLLSWLIAYAQVKSADVPIVLSIVGCESSFDENAYNYNKSSSTEDVGIFQINSSHWKEAERLGYNVHTTVGNAAYGLFLLQKEGVRPWRASWGCMGRYPVQNVIDYYLRREWPDTS